MLGPEVKCSWWMIDVAALQPKVVWSGEATGPVPTSMALLVWILPSHPLSMCTLHPCHASIWDGKDKGISQDSSKGKGQILGGSEESTLRGEGVMM